MTCLNISADHLDRYLSLEDYRQAKLKLYKQTKLIVYNRDDLLTKADANLAMQSFGLDSPELDSWGIEGGFFVHGKHKIFNINDLLLMGRHNQANFLAAMALSYAIKVNYASMQEVARTFTGLAHRCEMVAIKKGVKYINDSKATNIGATKAALDGLIDQANIILIAGGDGKGADFNELREHFAKLKALIVFGQMLSYCKMCVQMQ